MRRLAFTQKYFRSSHQMCSVVKGVLRNFAKFTGKHLYQRPATLLSKLQVTLTGIVKTITLDSISAVFIRGVLNIICENHLKNLKL